MATTAPSAASRFAIAAPMPREPPVTRATLPSSFFEFVLMLDLHCLDRQNSRDIMPVVHHISNNESIGRWYRVNQNCQSNLGRGAAAFFAESFWLSQACPIALWLPAPEPHKTRTSPGSRSLYDRTVSLAPNTAHCPGRIF